MKAKIDDVASAVGVSITLVSFAFNKPDRVAPATRERILAAAAELGYMPNPIARSMASGRTGTIGVLVPQALAAMARNPFFSELLAGVAEVTERLELPILLVSPRKGSMERAIGSAAVDGFLTIGLEEFRPTVQMLEQRQLPFVMVDSEPVKGIACVNPDDVGGAYTAMKAVLDAGHRRIGVLGILSPPPHDWRRYTGTLGRRVDGYRRALHEYGLDLDDVTLVESAATQDAGITATKRLLKRTPDLTAIVSMSDVCALGALDALAATGRSVPDDVSVVGFDGIPEARWYRPALTTVAQDPVGTGRVSAELLAGLIDGSKEPVHIVLPTEFLVGATLSQPK